MGMKNPNLIYMTVVDLQALMGYSEIHAYRIHAEIRRALSPADFKREGKVKSNLTIREYCKYVGDDFEEVWRALRGN